eukprot:353532-Chlamydomonas_euryale.AAC.8
MDGWMDGWMVGWMDEWMDGWMNGWMNEWMDGWGFGLKRMGGDAGCVGKLYNVPYKTKRVLNRSVNRSLLDSHNFKIGSSQKRGWHFGGTITPRLRGRCPCVAASSPAYSAALDEYACEPGSVLEFDIYGAGCLLPMSNAALVERALGTWLPAVVAATSATAAGGRHSGRPPRPRVVDSAVFRAPRAVTSFAPGSNVYMPDVQGQDSRLAEGGRNGQGWRAC